MRDHSHHIELSRVDAVAQMLEASGFDQPGPLLGCEMVALADAYGRVLAHDVAATTDLPNVLTCSMDSIAVHWSAFENLEEGTLPDTSAWVRGVDWEFANTGVAMPEGYDTAIVIEHVAVSQDEQHVEIDAAPSAQFAGTRAVGSQQRRGDVVATAGSIITPDVAAAIASAGHSSVVVVARPRVAFIPTGNELVPANLPFAQDAPDKYAGTGHVFESNSIVVKGKVEAWGGVYVPFDIVPDDYDLIKQAVEQAVQVADIVVLNAGSSKGSDDWSVEVLEEMGQVICHQTNHGPGHHSSYALVDGTPIVGISGPSGGASFTLNFYLLPLMKALLGLDPEPVRVPVRLAEGFPEKKHGAPAGGKVAGESRPREADKPGDVFFSIRFLKVEATPEGILSATPLAGRPGSASTQTANAFYMLPSGPGVPLPQAGDVIYVEMR